MNAGCEDSGSHENSHRNIDACMFEEHHARLRVAVNGCYFELSFGSEGPDSPNALWVLLMWQFCQQYFQVQDSGSMGTLLRQPRAQSTRS